MDAALQLVRDHGYWLLLAVGFAEYAGVPIASVPVLVAGGALARMGLLDIVPSVLSAATGALAADAMWYFMARWRGHRLVSTACGLTSNPGACILSVQERVDRIGSPYLLVAKFVPGAANLIAPAAGLAAIPPARFLGLDALGLMAWAAVYGSLGWIFSSQIERAMELVGQYSRVVLWGGLMLILAALLWRVVRLHLHDHPGSPGSPDDREP